MDSVVPSAGVVYTESHGLRMFRCEAQAVTLTDRSCLENYRAAKSQIEVTMRPALDHCRYCPIGAAHCGEKPRVRSSTFCARCHRTDLRFIKSHALCVSCYNRQSEVRRGKNSRGNPPIELLRKKPLKQRTVSFVHNGLPVRFRRLSADPIEPMLAALLLAKSPETIRFTFGRPDLEPVDNGSAPDWQRNSKLERRALDRERTKKRRESKRCGTR